MGNVLPNIFGKKEFKLFMIGLDAAGKTTLLFRLKLGEDITAIPTNCKCTSHVNMYRITALQMYESHGYLRKSRGYQSKL